MTYTLMKSAAGRAIYCSCGDSYSIVEFAGLCERCWIDLTPQERAILQGNEPPVTEVVHERTVITHLPPTDWFGILLIGTWRLFVAATLAFLLFRR